MRSQSVLRVAAFLLAAAPVPAPLAAAGWPDDRPGPRIVPRAIRVRPMPLVPPPVLIRDYRPRNHNIPMYNQPPARGPAW